MACVCYVTIGLQVDEHINQRGDWCLRKGITGGDIDFLYFCRNTMDGCLQQVLIAKHHCRSSIVGYSVLLS